ncbi:MAG: multidrug resistance protein [Blastochloris sp.]|nr:multidrug resistance protein [Blastochloris sp.]
MVTTLAPIFLATILGVAGQLLLKQGMSQMGTLQLSIAAVPSILLKMATSPFVISGLLVYVSGTFFWLMVLNRVPLSYSYPFVSLGIVLGMFAAWAIFRETVPMQRWIGLAVICVGIFLVARSK